MKRTSFIILFFICIIIIFKIDLSAELEINKNNPKISFTFDDGSINDMPNYPLKVWNQMILDSLKKYNLTAVFFVTGSYLSGKKGGYIISSWNNSGHKIGNHTFTHPYFNSKKVNLKEFKMELIKNDSYISQNSNYYRYFRFPFLKEGNTVLKRDGFRIYLKEKKYRIGHVSIDASDWYINKRLIKRLNKDLNADISGFKEFYIKHLYNRALFYDSLALKLTKRRISHTLLLHHNLASALFLEDLIQYFIDKGWIVIDADNAYKDKIYNSEPNTIPAGESLIWALAKQSGKFDSILRYPAEDSRYEKDEMDKLGL